MAGNKYTYASPVPAQEKKEHPLAFRMPLFDFYRKAWRQLNHIKTVAPYYHGEVDEEAVNESVKKLKRDVFFLAADRAIGSFLLYNIAQRTFGYTAYNPGFSSHEKTAAIISPISGFVVNSAINAIPAHKKGAYEVGFTVANYSLAATRTVLEQYMLNKRGINMDFATQAFGSYGTEAANQIYKFSATGSMTSEQNIRFQATSAWGEVVRMAGDVAILAFGKKWLSFVRNRWKENGMDKYFSLHKTISDEAVKLQAIADKGGAELMFRSDEFLRDLRLKQD